MARLLMQIRIRLQNPHAENEVALTLLRRTFEILDDRVYAPRDGGVIEHRYLTVSPLAHALPQGFTLPDPPPAAPALPGAPRAARRALPPGERRPRRR